MTLVKDITSTGTIAVRGLDLQVFDQLYQIALGSLSCISDLNINKGDGLFPYLQPAAREALIRATQRLPFKITVNNALRSVIAQTMLYGQHQRGLIKNLVAYPGKSDHQSGSSVDIEQWKNPMVKKAFLDSGWEWTYGEADPMHFDYRGEGITDIRPSAIRAFQLLWNKANPNDKIPVDSNLGPKTLSKIYESPAEGFSGLEGISPRILKLTHPVQQGRDVGLLQIRLRDFGYFKGSADMVFGGETDKAVKDYQAANNLHIDGVVGASTRKLLKF